MSPGGQVNGPLNEPFEIGIVPAEAVIILVELQSVSPISIVAVPLTSATQLLLLSCTPLPVTVTLEPAAPDVALRGLPQIT